MTREFDQYIAPDGSIYKFNDDIDKFVYGVQGQGMPPINYLTQQGPFQHGETVIDFRLQPRIIQLIHSRNANSRNDYWTNRSTLLNGIRPNRKSDTTLTGVLRKILPTGDIRDINVLVQTGPEFVGSNTDQWDEWAITEALRFVAHDPIFYDPTVNSQEFTLSTSPKLFFPFEFPFVFSGSTINITENIQTLGSWSEFPTIVIEGPINGVKITNNTTDEVIDLNYMISSGEIVTIDLSYGNKTVTNDSDDNLIGSITADSDIATFHIAPDPEATSGINSITVLGSGALIGTTSIEIQWLNRYIGI